eukprot:8651077-Heterocapsa_arctica.AAC.1
MPRNVEASRPREVTAALFQGANQVAPEALPRLVGWSQTNDPTEGELNAVAENQRFRGDSEAQWKKTRGKIWNGIPNPCGCGAF